MVHLSPSLDARLLQRLHATPLPRGARASRGGYLRALLLAALAEEERARKKAAHDILARYWEVGTACAARWFERLRGAAPLDELESAAHFEMVKGAQRFDASLGYSPAPYLRTWAEFGIKAYLRARWAEERRELVRPDQDEGEGGRSRWERLGGEDHALLSADERRATRAALVDWLRSLPPGERRAARQLLRGEGGSAAHRAQLQAELQRAGVEHQAGAELPLREAAQRYGLTPKVLTRLAQGGQLTTRMEDGVRLVREEEVRALARARR